LKVIHDELLKKRKASGKNKYFFYFIEVIN